MVCHKFGFFVAGVAGLGVDVDFTIRKLVSVYCTANHLWLPLEHLESRVIIALGRETRSSACLRRYLLRLV